MTVLAIDPGSKQSGYVVWDGEAILYSGVKGNDDLLYDVRRHSYDLVAIEQIGHYGSGMPAGRDVFDTCTWIGRFIQRRADSIGATERQCQLVLRAKIKTHFCGTAKAKDANVRQALIDRLGPKGTKANPGPTYGVNTHAWQALALAVYVTDNERILSTKKRQEFASESNPAPQRTHSAAFQRI